MLIFPNWFFLVTLASGRSIIWISRCFLLIYVYVDVFKSKVKRVRLRHRVKVLKGVGGSAMPVRNIMVG